MQTCRRCYGRGYLEITLGLAGQDQRQLPGGYADIKWGDTYPPTRCDVCEGTGLEKERQTRKGRYTIINTDQLDPFNMKANQ